MLGLYPNPLLSGFTNPAKHVPSSIVVPVHVLQLSAVCSAHWGVKGLGQGLRLVQGRGDSFKMHLMLYVKRTCLFPW